MYASGLVPRGMTWLGLIGGPLLLVGNIGVLFGWWEQTGAVGLFVAPEGFRPTAPILSAGER
ncbi:hypothetical protein OHA21_14730 [Actinoplanes sp. NBC_00393]|uniref:hypothetical protein n=1 Tax=Actinoplanes sp. NBC_00393 TaxID=2975953 RepID=UPI002E23AAE7